MITGAVVFFARRYEIKVLAFYTLRGTHFFGTVLRQPIDFELYTNDLKTDPSSSELHALCIVT